MKAIPLLGSDLDTISFGGGEGLLHWSLPYMRASCFLSQWCALPVELQQESQGMSASCGAHHAARERGWLGLG